MGRQIFSSRGVLKTAASIPRKVDQEMSILLFPLQLGLLVGVPLQLGLLVGVPIDSSQPMPYRCMDRRSLLAACVLVAPCAAKAADVSLGSSGISSYEKLQLTRAIDELVEATNAAKATPLNGKLDAYIEATRLVSAESLDKISTPALEAAIVELKQLAAATGRDVYEAEAASIDKRGRALIAACAMRNAGPAAVAATKLAAEVTDLAYEFAATEKPLQAIQDGAPSTKPKSGYVSDEDISKTMKRQL